MAADALRGAGAGAGAPHSLHSAAPGAAVGSMGREDGSAADVSPISSADMDRAARGGRPEKGERDNVKYMLLAAAAVCGLGALAFALFSGDIIAPASDVLGSSGAAGTSAIAIGSFVAGCVLLAVAYCRRNPPVGEDGASLVGDGAAASRTTVEDGADDAEASADVAGSGVAASNGKASPKGSDAKRQTGAGASARSPGEARAPAHAAGRAQAAAAAAGANAGHPNEH